MMVHYSKAVESVRGALSIQINQMVYDLRRMGQDVITLSLGEAFFDIPQFDFGGIDFSQGYHYSDTQGLPELRRHIANYYAQKYGTSVDADREVIISAGSKALVYMSMLSLVDPGDLVVIPEPAWLSYEEQAHLVGARVRFVPYNLPVQEYGSYIGDETRLVIICNPNNPAGRAYSEDELMSIYQLCREREIALLADEAYSDFVGRPGEFTSLARIAPDKDGVVVVNSLSKNMGMSGWRIGYAISAPGTIDRLTKVNQHLVTCAPTVLQSYVSRYFDDLLGVTLPQVEATVEKRARIARMMDEFALERLGGESTFYFFVDIGDYPHGSVEFAVHLLRMHGIAVVPGIAYGDSTDRFIRVSIGTESEERIHEALMVVSAMVRQKDWPPEILEPVRHEAAGLYAGSNRRGGA